CGVRSAIPTSSLHYKLFERFLTVTEFMAIDLYGQITVRLQLARVSLCKGA
ncbi:1800_t:CDS:2, partial [Paraglomus brasilianum]